MSKPPLMVVGNYEIYEEIAAGGIATVHFGRFRSAAGFNRTVAIKRLHPQYAKDPHFVAMFIDEARLAARISHPCVVSILDVVSTEIEMFLVMEYIRGESLSKLLQAQGEASTPVPIAVAVGVEMLQGLHAAHEATTEQGEPLNLVHRDVSPQNVMIGIDGHARVLDFGVALAAQRTQMTRQGEVKGKASYLSPEQIDQHPVDRRSDIFSASIVLWETLTCRRLFAGDNMLAISKRILEGQVEPPSRLNPEVPSALDAIVLKGLSTDPAARFATAMEMANALQQAVRPAAALQVGAWMDPLAKAAIKLREAKVKSIESMGSVSSQFGDDLAQIATSIAEARRRGEDSSITTAMRRRRLRRIALAAAAVVALAGLGAFWAQRHGGLPWLAAASPVDTTAPDGALAAAGAGTTDGGAAAQVEAHDAAPAADTAPAVEQERPERSKSARKTSRSSRRGAKRQGNKRHAGGAKACDPPYRIDADGVRIPKPECL